MPSDKCPKCGAEECPADHPARRSWVWWLCGSGKSPNSKGVVSFTQSQGCRIAELERQNAEQSAAYLRQMDITNEQQLWKLRYKKRMESRGVTIRRLLQENAEQAKELESLRDENRGLRSAHELLNMLQDSMERLCADRDELGRAVRVAWIAWAKKHPNPKPSWLVPYSDLGELNKEADRQIGEAMMRAFAVREAEQAALIKRLRERLRAAREELFEEWRSRSAASSSSKSDHDAETKRQCEE